MQQTNVKPNTQCMKKWKAALTIMLVLYAPFLWIVWVQRPQEEIDWFLKSLLGLPTMMLVSILASPFIEINIWFNNFLGLSIMYTGAALTVALLYWVSRKNRICFAAFAIMALLLSSYTSWAIYAALTSKY